jgi:hypothetical protein
MFIPKGMTEQEVIDIIEKVANEFGKSFAFGYYELDDIKQEIRMESIKILPLYDPMDKDGNPTRPLANFLYRNAMNKVLNLWRNKCQRRDAPCKLCHEGREYEHPNGKHCHKYLKWRKLNSTKAHLTRPLTLCGIDEESESNIATKDFTAESVDANELREIINKKLNPSLRTDYLRMLAKEKIPSTRRKIVEEAIKEILAQYQ